MDFTKTKLPVSVLIDVDLFKRINDNEGHLTGDTVLVELCHVISGRIRACDTFARWGGEEFMILLPDCEYPNASVLAEQVRSLIEETMFSCANQVTCSFGVTELHVDDSLESLTGRVDDALYRAKKNGRNRVEVIA